MKENSNLVKGYSAKTKYVFKNYISWSNKIYVYLLPLLQNRRELKYTLLLKSTSKLLFLFLEQHICSNSYKYDQWQKDESSSCESCHD